MTDAMASPSDGPGRADGRRNRERLLAAAQATFAEQGTDASLREVARRAGVGVGTLYRHFPTREALLEALLRHGFDMLRDRAENLLASPEPGHALTGWTRDLAEVTGRWDGLPSSVMAALHDPRSRLHASCEGLRAAVGNLLARAQRAGAIRPDLTADELMAAANAMAWAARQAPGAADRLERYLTLAFEGLTAHPDPYQTTR